MATRTVAAKPGMNRSAWRSYLPMALLALFFLFPVVFMIVSSFKPDTQIFEVPYQFGHHVLHVAGMQHGLVVMRLELVRQALAHGSLVETEFEP